MVVVVVGQARSEPHHLYFGQAGDGLGPPVIAGLDLDVAAADEGDVLALLQRD